MFRPLVVLAVATLLPRAPAAPPPSTPGGGEDLPTIAWNDNDRPAGRLEGGILRLDLEVRRGSWHPFGPDEPGAAVLAFAETGTTPTIPAPLLRVPRGTRVEARVTNPLDVPLEVQGLSGRAEALGLEWVRIAPGETRELAFLADVEGTHMYRGRLPQPSPTASEPYEADMLGGAFIVDGTGHGVDDDEVMVIQIFFGDRKDDGEPDFSEEYLTINGRPWPHTKRLSYEMGDTVRWRVVNASEDVHPMHLHGFFFEVESRGDMARDSLYWPAQRRMAVTELMMPWTTMKLNWVPDRPGGWIFHCHLTFHVQATPPMGVELPDEEEQFEGWLRGEAAHDGHDHTRSMGGLVMAIEIAPPSGWIVDRPGPDMKRLHIHADSMPGHPVPRFSAVLEEEGGPTEPVASFPGSLLLLPEGPPATVRVLNHTDEPTQLHWHGLELESYYDGVPGGTGYEGRRTPPIMARDSFDVVLRTTRPGTYIYHTHMSDIRQQGSGLYGPLVVVPANEPWDPDRERIFILGEGMGEEEELSEHLYLNGGRGETPIEMEAGREQRLRFINITLGAPLPSVRLLRDGYPVRWTPVAEDAYEIPEHRRTPVLAERRISMGQTFDFLYTPPDAVDLVLEVRSARGQLLVSQPIVVRPPRVAAQDQIAAAVQAAPEEARAQATVLGWDREGKVSTLREGTNHLVCLADDPRDQSWSVACYHRDLEPYMARGRELRAEGRSGEDAAAQRFREVEEGKLTIPEGRMLYVLSGSGWNAAEQRVEDAYLRWVIYRPYATSEGTGVPARPRSPGEPWLMDGGSVGAHIMITPPRGGGS